MLKGLEGMAYEEQLRSLFSTQRREGLGEDSWWTTAPHKGNGRETLSSALWLPVIQHEEMSRSCNKRDSGCVLGEGSSSPECGRALEEAPQSNCHDTEPAKVQEAFGQLSQKYGLILGYPVWSWELLSVIFMGLFQLRIFYDFTL